MVKLHIRVKAGSRKNEIVKTQDGMILIKVKAPAIEGKANKALVNFLSEQLNIAQSKIAIVKGENSPFKTIEINTTEIVLNKLI